MLFVLFLFGFFVFFCCWGRSTGVGDGVLMEQQQPLSLPLEDYGGKVAYSGWLVFGQHDSITTEENNSRIILPTLV